MRVPILTYHSLDESGSVISVRPADFAKQMQTLYSQGFRAVSLTELLHALQDQRHWERTVAITFDDGFESIYHHAMPVLADYGFAATVFLVSDYCDRTNDWPGQAAHVPRLRLLRWSQVREMTALGIQFGAHTKTHPNLKRLPEVAAREEIIGSKKAIEDHVQHRVDAFAYPYGAYDSLTSGVVREHFRVACSADLDYVRPGCNPVALERVDAFYLRSESFFRHLLSYRTVAYVRVRRALRDFRRVWHD